MKKDTERRAKTLGFDCYFDLETGLMRSTGSDLKELAFTLVLLLHYLYSKLMWLAFFELVERKTIVHPEKGETLMQMYEKMWKMLEEQERRDKEDERRFKYGR